jgi:nitroimidazol reductase NimA-like FMN-containing flavoprotein (pyridoxamine 5'-phosphate oxidase superfamily)
MSADETKERIAGYLKDHSVLTLATVTPDCRPLAHTVSYVSEGATVFFATLKTTRKYHNIRRNPAVAYTVDEDYPEWIKIRGIQMEGNAEILAEPGEIARVRELYVKKFPAAADFPEDLDMAYIGIRPVACFFLDFSKGFSHRDEVKF